MNGLDREAFETDITVFSSGDDGESAYVIERGCVEILTGPLDEQKRVAVLAEGAMFGEMALLDRLPRSATVRTLMPTTLVRIDRAHVEELLARADPVIQYLLKLLLARFRNSAGAMLAPIGGAPQGSVELHTAAVHTLSVAHDLADGIDGDQLLLYYQPIILLESNKPLGFEALVRWKHPKRGLISPDEFIPLAEKTGLIYRIGDWVLNRAINDWKVLREFCVDDDQYRPFLSVNLSAPELCRPGIVQRIEEGLVEQKMLPSELRIELTEAVIISNLEAVSKTIDELRSLDIGIALDDFGKGYAGLDSLQTLPFTCIKIDKSFVDQIHTSERSFQIIKTAIDLSQQLGLSTVAEGIEDEVTGQRLREMGCNYGQGYFYARPLPLDDVKAWFDRFTQ